MEHSRAGKALEQLTPREKIDLITFRSTTAVETWYKLLDIIIQNARDEAMEIAPHETKRRLAAMDVAYAMDKGFRDLRNIVDAITQQHIADTKAIAAKELMMDKERIADIIVRQ